MMSCTAVSRWDAEARRYDQEPDHGLYRPEVRAAWRRIIEDALPAPPADVLDLACGTGSLSVLLALDGYRVTAIDASQAMIDAARRKAAAFGARVTIRRGDAAQPSVEDGSVDAVLVRYALWLLPDRAAVVRRWARLLRPHGVLVLVEDRWWPQAGRGADDLVEVVSDAVPMYEVVRLDSDDLWGGQVDDERLLVVVRRPVSILDQLS